MNKTTGPQCKSYFETGHACPGCEQCAPAVQAQPVAGDELIGAITEAITHLEKESPRAAQLLLRKLRSNLRDAATQPAAASESVAEFLQFITSERDSPMSMVEFQKQVITKLANLTAANKPAAPSAGTDLQAAILALHCDTTGMDATHALSCKLGFRQARAAAASLAASAALTPHGADIEQMLDADEASAAQPGVEPVAEVTFSHHSNRIHWLSEDAQRACRDGEKLYRLAALAAPAAPAVQPVRYSVVYRDGNQMVPVEVLGGYADSTSTVVTIAAPIAAAVPEMSVAARDVLAERRRQVEAEGWTPYGDDTYLNYELAHAAAAYAYPALTAVREIKVWPWSLEWLKIRDHRTNVVKAAALLLAEIERTDRAAACAATPAAPTTGSQQ